MASRRVWWSSGVVVMLAAACSPGGTTSQGARDASRVVVDGGGSDAARDSGVPDAGQVPDAASSSGGVDAGAPDAAVSVDAGTSCEPPPRTTVCPDTTEPFQPHCYNAAAPCDCPTPPDDACISTFPTENVTLAARWVPGPFPPNDPRSSWSGAWAWAPAATSTTRYLVTLHGTDETAAKELYWWHPRVQRLRECYGVDLGILAVQYHDPLAGAEEGYVQNEQLVELVNHVLATERNAGRAAAGGHVFHGFSRGSANMYSLAVADTPPRWGTRYVANSGAWPPGGPRPPIVAQVLDQGSATALQGVSFYVFYSLQDHDPDTNGVNAQANAASVVRQLGGTAVVVEDETGCHSVMEMGADHDRAWPALLWALELDG
ncbi:MAG: hypothetical protein AB2A00_41335 [Myxococcota bacterium]